MLRQAGTAESVAGAEQGGHPVPGRCLGWQREMPETLDAPQRERYSHEYLELRPQLEALFRKRFPTLRGQEADFYNDAWESLLQSETQPDALFAYLDRALYTRGLNELRRRDRRPGDQAQAGEPVELDSLTERTDREPGETVVDDIAAAATQKLLLDRLSPRQARIMLRLRPRRRGVRPGLADGRRPVGQGSPRRAVPLGPRRPARAARRARRALVVL